MREQMHLRELSLDNIGQWPRLLKFGVLLGSCILITMLGYWFFIKVNFEKFSAQKAKTISLQSKIALKLPQGADVSVSSQQLQEIEERFVAMSKQFSLKKEIPSLLEEIFKTGVASGLILNHFAPQPAVIHAFYSELPIKITMEGSYTQLAMFLNQMASMSRLITIHELSIEKQVIDENKKVSDYALLITLKAKIIYRDSENETME